jgi:uroporphyrinogen-III decarboxylase
VIASPQEHVTIDEIYFAEDICYKHGTLTSPDMMREFLLPYYQQVITNLKRRQLDRGRHIYWQIDTGVYAIPVYREIGMDAMSAFEVASGCDVVAVGQEHPDLAIFGGIDKRVLASGRDAIDEMLERILPPARERGGHIPTCGHRVPQEVPYEDHLYYKKRAVELGG